MSTQDAILLVAHGTVSSNAEIPEFLRKIRRGRGAPPELVAELSKRYDAIGGSPLMSITEAQGAALSALTGLPCYVAMRLWHPFVEEVLPKLALAGIRRAVVLPLAPFSVDVYVAAARTAAAGIASPVTLLGAESWAHFERFIAASAELIRRHLPSQPSRLILTAHSLPTRVIQLGDRYADEVRRCADAIAAELALPAALAYQSQGADGGDWLGPDLHAILRIAQQEGEKHVTIAPIGFLADHVETLYDLDIEAKSWCEELGMKMTRVPALNTDPALLDVLADVARKALS